jgi:hypothetical protein
MIANGKHRKKRIFSLDDVNGKIEGQVLTVDSVNIL